MPKIALIAPANGKKWSAEIEAAINKRIELLQRLGFCAYIPRYEDGSMVFEPDAPGGHAEIGDSHARGVSADTGAKQIIECAENGCDIITYMGGWGFVDKIGTVIEHFKDSSLVKPKKPIRIFGFSDNTFAAFLQSHHPDIFQFYSTNVLSYLLKNDAEIDAAERPIFERNVGEMQSFFKTGALTPYERPLLSRAGKDLSNMQSVQYFPLHNDMIWADSTDFDIAKGGEFCFGHMPVKAPQLETSKPYILGLEGFLQKPTTNKKYDTQFPKYLDEFLRQRQAKGQLPKIVEIGLFTTRIDGANGYIGLLHNEENGLIEINDFNIDRIFRKMEEQKAKGEISGLVKQIIEVLKSSSQEAAKYDNSLTQIPESIKAKVSTGIDLTKEDIAAILESENQKILKIREVLVGICNEYGVPTVLNTRCGHTLNIGVVGGGNVSLKLEADKIIFEQLPILQTSLAGDDQEKPRSVFEAAQAGKYGKLTSLGGARDLSYRS